MFNPPAWLTRLSLPGVCFAEGDPGSGGGGGGAAAPSGATPQTHTVRLQVEAVQPQKTPADPPATPRPRANSAASAGAENAGDGDGGDGGRRGEPTKAELRAEAAAYRIEMRKAQEALAEMTKEREAALASVEAKVAEKAKEFEPRLTRLQQRLLQAELKTHAVAAGIEDLDVLPLLEGVTGLRVTLDDAGDVVGAEAAIAKFKELKPGFFKSAGAGNGSAARPAAADGDNPATGNGAAQPPRRPTGSGAAPQPAAGDQIPDAKKMTPEQYNAFKRDRMRALRTVA